MFVSAVSVGFGLLQPTPDSNVIKSSPLQPTPAHLSLLQPTPLSPKPTASQPPLTLSFPKGLSQSTQPAGPQAAALRRGSMALRWLLLTLAAPGASGPQGRERGVPLQLSPMGTPQKKGACPEESIYQTSGRLNSLSRAATTSHSHLAHSHGLWTAETCLIRKLAPTMWLVKSRGNP